jgi:hypothetical protein
LARVIPAIIPGRENWNTMKGLEFPDTQKAFILKQGNVSVPVVEISGN